MNIKEGDVCRVDMAIAQRGISDFGTGHGFKILRDIVRQGGGYVDVDEIRGVNAMVSAHDNPGSKMMGGVQVPISALRFVAPSKTAEGYAASERYTKIAQKVVAGLK